MRRPILFALAAVAVLLIPAPAYADHELTTIYLATDGANVNDGLTPATAVRTLERVEQIATAATGDVEVRISQGTYDIGETLWTTYIPGHTITFMPVDYEIGEGVGDFAGRPVFVGDGEWWFEARLPSGNPGGTTGLRFHYLQVEGYRSGGILIHGGYEVIDGYRVPSTAGANGNEFRGMYFRQLGSLHNPGPFGYAAIDLINSSNNLIRANHFVRLENAEPDWSHIHGVYAAHGSSNNQIINNDFAYISGAPVNFRNMSNNNDITGNTFDHTGKKSYYSDWFCGPDCAATSGVQECASQGNEFHDNSLVVGYDGAQVPVKLLYPDGAWYAGGPSCAPLTSERVYAGDNPTGS